MLRKSYIRLPLGFAPDRIKAPGSGSPGARVAVDTEVLTGESDSAASNAAEARSPVTGHRQATREAEVP